MTRDKLISIVANMLFVAASAALGWLASNPSELGALGPAIAAGAALVLRYLNTLFNRPVDRIVAMAVPGKART